MPRDQTAARHQHTPVLLTPDDVRNLAEAVVAHYRSMVWLGAVLGLRWSEVAGLRVGAVDMFQRS